MATKADEIIKLRNEGMAYALKIAKEHGVEELEKQVKIRGYLKCSVRFTPEELNKSCDNVAERIYNNMLTMVYAVLHDQYEFGKKRLQRFKEEFDQKVYGVSERDPMGQHYARFWDYAEEANRLYDLGIDIDRILETQKINDELDKERGIYVSADSVISYLKDHNFPGAAETLRRRIYKEE